MELVKELLKSGGLLVLVVLGAFYVLGWQYYLGLFHALHVGMFLLLPPETAIGAGMHPAVVFLIVALAGWSIGWLWSAVCEPNHRLFAGPGWEKRKSLGPSLAGSVALLTPACLEIYSRLVDRTPDFPMLKFSYGYLSGIALLATAVAFLVAFLGRRNWMKEDPARHYWYFFLALAFLVGGSLYAEALGANIAQNLGKDGKGYVNLRFKEKELQAECGSQKFLPLFMNGEDIVLVAMSGSQPESICSIADSSSTRLVVVKKETVQVLSITSH
jgi:hypothetical protein